VEVDGKKERASKGEWGVVVVGMLERGSRGNEGEVGGGSGCSDVDV